MSDSQDMNITVTNSKRETILLSAWEVFSSYGFRRTSMQDIADKAGISRPALYLEFNNKTDIFRGLAKSVFQQNLVDVSSIFKTDLSLEDKLLKVLTISFSEFYQTMQNTPHGDELLSIKTELAGDIYLDWLCDIKLAIRHGIESAVSSEKIVLAKSGLKAEEIADIIINTMHGSKSLNTSFDDLKKKAKSVVKLVMASIKL